jgi:multidrug resistance efflux pump
MAMLRRLLLPLIAAVLFGFALLHVVRANQSLPKTNPPVTPAQAPFGRTVAGAGLVEARTENIAIGSHLPGVVVEVLVKVGQKVKAGTPLFRLDDRQLRADLKLREANLAAALAQLAKLESMPRQEELPPSEARVREAEANLQDHEDQYKRARTLYGSRAVGEEEWVRRKQALRMAREQLARARAEYDLLRAGAWEPDKAVARTAVTQAQAQVEQTRTELDRLVVRAPVDGDVLQVNVRPGEYVGAPPGMALVVLGDVHNLHIRVDIDENDIPRFRPGLPARAMVRGNPRQEFPLSFVRVEPFVIPKKSLTGDNTERVDTRVLQVIYQLHADGRQVFVGQQLDVFLDDGEESSPRGDY